eukprot:TRINITY_DN14230_c0_g1_i8.p1 TRINITY_DN14230_c0_g1~~TRINITY_DN14230_c0_g1_i8.p1  ORF type:complete len:102 (-),score=19.98 TRINITY_DN14230_c0_g1_i8:53-358(-)
MTVRLSSRGTRITVDTPDSHCSVTGSQWTLQIAIVQSLWTLQIGSQWTLQTAIVQSQDHSGQDSHCSVTVDTPDSHCSVTGSQWTLQTAIVQSQDHSGHSR